MKKRITITVTGLVDIPPFPTDRRDVDLIDVLAQALSDHFPEFQADPHHAPIMVTVEDLPHRRSSAVRAA
jgi:hypothetical protein